MTASMRSQIIVGIDFGTTHSGVSWVLNEGQKKIRLINDWPNPTAINANADKVPSTISYEHDAIKNWGYFVDLSEEPFRWFKILLDPESKYSQAAKQVHQSNELLGKMNKTAEQVVSDYLGEIWKYSKEDIRKRVLDDDWESNFEVHVVLTVPAIWSHAAKDKTLKAAALAGLPANIRLVTEPEAAALATLRDKVDDDALRKGDAFVVCDAGGGTVDLISYKVNSLRPLEIEECAIGDGGLCGSVFLDLAFERYIKTIVGQDQYNRLKDRDKKKMLLTFEYGVKRAFTANPTREYSVDLRGIEDNETEGIIDETITLKQTAMHSLFDYVCGQIETLVQNQISDVERNKLNVKAILLVGGFGSSKFLHNRLEQSYSAKAIAVLQIEGAWSAICRGACLWGLEYVNQPLSNNNSGTKPTVTLHISKYSYGVVVYELFDSKRHLTSDRSFSDFENGYIANNQMRWLLRRGDRFAVGDEVKIQVRNHVHGIGLMSHGGSREFVQSLYYCQDAAPPPRMKDSVKQLCHVKYSVPEKSIWSEKSSKSAATAGKWRSPVFDLRVQLGSATLEYTVKYKEHEVASVEAEYVEPL